MKLNDTIIQRFLGTLIFTRAQDYYRSGRVGKLTVSAIRGGTHVSAPVRGTFEYNSSADIFDSYIRLSCSCPAHITFGRCKHSGAVLLKYAHEAGRMHEAASAVTAAPRESLRRPAAEPPRPRLQQSDSASQLLARYSAAPRRVTIEPTLYFNQHSLFATFTIGADRQYVVKSLAGLVNLFRRRETAEYGKNFTFTHDPAALDERSRQLLKLISAYCDQVARSAAPRPYESPETRNFHGVAAPTERHLPLISWTMDDFFDLCQDMALKDAVGGESWALKDEDPMLSMTASDCGEGYVRLALDGRPVRIPGVRHDYVVIDHTVYRFSADFADTVDPLMQTGTDLIFSPQGAEEFCQNVLPRMRDLVPLSGENAFAPYMPSDVDVRYYIDMPERGRLTAQPFFAYGSTIVEADDPLSLHPDIRRNGQVERAAIQALIGFFDPPAEGGKLYELTNEDRMYDFLAEGMEKLGETGEVFVSDRLKNIRLKKPSRMSIGVSVGESVLNLSLDLGEFPMGELESLRDAMREKRKYYRLADGRFLDTGSSELNAFAQVADALDLSFDDLRNGSVEVPMSRALYLDSALRQDSDLTFTRDAEFRRLVRDFRTVDDSDFAVPEPLDGVLRNYQKTGYRWLRTLDAYRFGGILADDMGLGKTLQVLTYLLSIRRERQQQAQPGPRASLIVCPASLVLNWAEEARRWTPELVVCQLTGSAASRELDIMRREEYDILITSYDLLKRDIESHRQANYYACILDEAQYIKNHETKGSKAVKDVRAMVRIALTGTPVENRLSELWSIFDFLMPGYLYKYAAFRSRMETPIAKNADAKAQDNLRRLVSPFILRRMKKDVLSELPPKIETVHYVQMEDTQRKTYLAYALSVKQALESSTEKDKMRILAMLTRLRQLCCDPSLWVADYDGGSCKLDECARMLEELTESGHSVLVFSQFTTMLDRIRDRLDDRGIDSFTLQGDTPRETRAELVNAFNRGEAPVFLISLKAGGTGLNLTAADTVIHFDPWWNIAAQNQATDRCYRIGQTRKVQVYQLIAKDTIEENILRLQSSKQKLVESIVDASEGSLMNMSKEELMSLLDCK